MTSDFLGNLEFTDGFGALAVVVAVLLPIIIGLVAWLFRRARQPKEDAGLVTSHYRLLGGMNIPYTYEVSVHNATPHPLPMVEVKYWDGTAWRLKPARSSRTGGLVINPGDTGIASVPAVTMEPKDFDGFYFIKYTDSQNRVWHRLINSPDFLSPDEVRQIERFQGTI
ncbi:hypothetical protein [Pseudarthrobacter quantipunctorum]|uniref:Uncharacterized protein n=1 Tax=Pseudarthrobacter quantipunctorum TaxID=3128980 RepID=A0ABZ2RD88_9MICC